MKEGWEYKTLGEVASIINGRNQKAVENEDGEYPICGSGGIIGYANDYICPEETVIVGRKGNINRPIFMTKKFWNVDTAFGIVAKQTQLLPKYLYYFCIDFNFEKLNKAVTIPSLVKADLLRIKLFIPPLPEQQQIVEELDLLTSIIDKKKAQLKELDSLAQSIFYEMFGDPITNEKGWEVKKLKEVSTLLNGKAYKQQELLSDGKYKVLRVGNFFTNSNFYYSDLELEENKYCDKGDLLFAWSASFGAFIWGGEKVIYHYHIWKVLYDKSLIDIHFYQYLLNIMTKFFMKDVHGIGMIHLTKVGMEQYSLPLPPLSLQHQFAEKVEAIEHQKDLIKQSIKEVETLFNSRMDYYFN